MKDLKTDLDGYMEQINEWATDTGVNLESITFFQNKAFESVDDTEFGYCDITGEKGECVKCVAQDKDGQTVEFQALVTLVGGSLGRAAGAF